MSCQASSERTFEGVVQKVAAKLSEVPCAVAACLVGSATRPYAASPVDLDFLLFVDALQPSRITFHHLASADRQSAHSDPVWFRSEDTIRARWAPWEIGIAATQPKTFDRRLQEILTGRRTRPLYRTWTIGASAPEVKCADLCDAVVLFDRNQQINLWKQSVATYPETLRAAILRQSAGELAKKLQIAQCALEEEDVITERCCLHSTFFPAIRGLFALHRVYFRGMRHLQAQMDCLIPDRGPFIRNLILQSHGRTALLGQLLREFSEAVPSPMRRRSSCSS